MQDAPHEGEFTAGDGHFRLGGLGRGSVGGVEFRYGSREVSKVVGEGGGWVRGVVEWGIAHGEVQLWGDEEGGGEKWGCGVRGDEVDSGVERVKG